MTDAELLARFVSQQDQAALTQLVHRYERLVWSVCSRLLSNSADREDAFQTTFLILVKNVHRIRKPSSLSNWLYGTAWKVASRIRKSRAIHSLDVVELEGFEVADSGQSQLDVIARQHEIDLVDHHLQAMSERDRTPLIMYYFSGLTAKEIAHQLQLTIAATEGRIRRARARLREVLQRDGIRYGSLAMLGALGYSPPQPALASMAIERCVATCAGSAAGTATGTFSLGTKLMICKGMCVFGISTLLALGSLLHTDSPSDTTTAQVVDMAVDSVMDIESADTVAFAQSGPNSCPLMKGIAGCCEVCDVFHAHMTAAHESIAVRANGLCDFVFGDNSTN